MADPLPPGLLPLVKLQGLNPSYRMVTADGKATTEFTQQFASLIGQIVDGINGIIIAYNAALDAQQTAAEAAARAMMPQIDRQSTSPPPLGLPSGPSMGSQSSNGAVAPPLAAPILGRMFTGDVAPRPSLGERSLALPEAITVGASPFNFQAPSAGTVVVTAGTGLAVVFTRDGATFISLPDSTTMRVNTGDVIRVTYATAPAMTFIEG